MKYESLFVGKDSIYIQFLKQYYESNVNSLAPTAIIQEYYDATLLVCDAKTLELETFYTVDASRGSRLLISSDGKLEWYVEKVVAVYYYPSNSLHFMGTLDLLRYRFDATGALIDYEDTGTDVRYAE